MNRIPLTAEKGLIIPWKYDCDCHGNWIIPQLSSKRIKCLKTFESLNYFSIGLILIYLSKTHKVSDRYKPKVLELLRSHYDLKLETFDTETPGKINTQELDSNNWKIDPEVGCNIIKVYSRIDGGYIGSPDTALNFLRQGIAPQKATVDSNSCLIGFCEKEQKWYGWARAFYGFGIGSKVKEGDIGYIEADPQEIIDEIKLYYNHQDYRNVKYINKVTHVLVRGEIKRNLKPVSPNANYTKVWQDFEECYPVGKGEWAAESLDDAKQMAIDFALGCS